MSIESGQPEMQAAVEPREAQIHAGTRAHHLFEFVGQTTAAPVSLTVDNGHYLLTLQGVPGTAEGITLGETVADMIDALREYAENWIEDLHDEPDHQDRWNLVTLVMLSTDEQLAQWLLDRTPIQAI